jgi:UDP-N-acetylmuramate--alanine ligase
VSVFRSKVRKLHFVGIGGAGMSGIAEVLLNQGFEISGSDQRRSPLTDHLASLGARVFLGHAASHVAGVQVVVTSTAVPADNPEVLEARRLAIPVIPRAEMLAELMRPKYAIAVSGSHGKTTTTSMVACVLDAGGLDPTIVVGGRLSTLGSGARLGKGEYVVAEADESDRSFLKLYPTLAVVTNVDREHLDTYRDLADVQQAFAAFVARVPFYGALVVCSDDPPANALIARVSRRSVSYGLGEAAQVRARAVEVGPGASRYLATLEGAELGPIELHVPGVHNVRNSLAAVSVGLELGLPFEAVQAGLAAFRGVERRFQLKGEAGGVSVLDDYGHHPTEIVATLAALKAWAGGRRTLVLFQPHRYTRTQALFDEFAGAFGDADRLLVADVYPAGEAPIPEANAEALARAIAARGGEALYVGSLEQASEALAREALPGDVVLTLGAGNVHQAGEALLARRVA